jgi:hypothetical protein
VQLADFDKSYSFLRADLEPLLAERERLSGGTIDGPTKALSRHDRTVCERRRHHQRRTS